MNNSHHNLRLTAILGCAAVVIVGCNSAEGSAEDSGDEPVTTAPAAPNDAVVESDSVDQNADALDLTLSGGLNANITEPSGMPVCSFRENEFFSGWTYNVYFPLEIDGEHYDITITHDAAEWPGTHVYDAGDVNLLFSGARPFVFSSQLSEVPAEGTVTIKDDLTGEVDATISNFANQDYEADPLTIVGTWSCAELNDHTYGEDDVHN